MAIEDLEVLEKLEKNKFRRSEPQDKNNSEDLPLENLLESLKASEPSYLNPKSSDGDEEE